MIRGSIHRLDDTSTRFNHRCDLFLGGEEFKNVRYCTGLVLVIQIIFCRVIALRESNTNEIVWINKKSLLKNQSFKQYCLDHQELSSQTLKHVLHSLSSSSAGRVAVQSSVDSHPPVVVNRPAIDITALNELGPSALMVHEMIERGPHRASTSDWNREDRMLEIESFIDCICDPDYLTAIAEILYKDCPDKDRILKCLKKSLVSEETDFMQLILEARDNYPRDLIQEHRGELCHAESTFRYLLFCLFSQAKRGEPFHLIQILE